MYMCQKCRIIVQNMCCLLVHEPGTRSFTGLITHLQVFILFPPSGVYVGIGVSLALIAVLVLVLIVIWR